MTPATKEEIDLWHEQWENMHTLEEADDLENADDALGPDAVWHEQQEEGYDEEEQLTYYDSSDSQLERVAVPDHGQPVAVPAYAYDSSSQSYLYPDAGEEEEWDQSEGWDPSGWSEDQGWSGDASWSSDWQESSHQWSGNG